jgi:hypothetical protein
MPSSSASLDLPVGDLHLLLDLALARGASLLTAGELVVVRRIRSLEGSPARLFARLTSRRTSVFAVDRLVEEASGVGEALQTLIDAQLADRLVSWKARLEASTMADLRPLLRARGLPVTGRRTQLLERLAEPGPWSRRFVRLRHTALLHRLEQWAMLSRHPDRSRFVVQRLGHVRWPEYERTTGGALHPDRRALVAWERIWRDRDEAEPEVLLSALDAREHWPPGRLDLRPSLCRRVVQHARERERAGDLGGARSLYEGLVRGGHLPEPLLAVRLARTLELEGRASEALDRLSAARGGARGAERLGIARTGKRLAARVRRGWAPDRPLRIPQERHLQFPRAAPVKGRPGWREDGRVQVVEQAVIARLAKAGRRALHAEGGLWTTLFALLFAETYFLPVPGMLPVPFLTGPLDLGRPSFRRRRPEVDALLRAVRSGQAPERIRGAWAQWHGTALAGARWERAGCDALVSVAEGMGADALAALLEVLLDQGWAASRGLPDLVVLPGKPTRVPHALPSRLPAGLLLVEVKGPSDSVRDEQAVWFDRLLRTGALVELWKIDAA